MFLSFVLSPVSRIFWRTSVWPCFAAKCSAVFSSWAQECDISTGSLDKNITLNITFHEENKGHL